MPQRARRFDLHDGICEPHRPFNTKSIRITENRLVVIRQFQPEDRVMARRGAVSLRFVGYDLRWVTISREFHE
jgi:hypothetical protein